MRRRQNATGTHKPQSLRKTSSVTLWRSNRTACYVALSSLILANQYNIAVDFFQKLIDALYECVDGLQRNKVDIGNAQSIFDLDAYKSALDSKVAFTLFKLCHLSPIITSGKVAYDMASDPHLALMSSLNSLYGLIHEPH